MKRPFPQSYWVHEGLLCAGHYPGAPEQEEHRAKVAGLVACGIRRVINLIPEHETGRNGLSFVSYLPELQEFSARAGTSVECVRMGFADGSVPNRELMSRILDAVDASMASGEPLYLHCWGGHGRTGTTVACHLIRHGHTPQEAIERILSLRAGLPRNHFPFEGRQEEFVRTWQPGE